MTYSQGRGSGSRLDNRRALAAVVDLAVIAAGGLLISLAAGGDFTGPIAAVSIGWALFYYFAFESDGGQTLGKRLLKLRVERATGGPAAPRDIAVRTGLRLVDGLGLYLVGLGVMLFTRERRQRLGDLAAKTVVVDVTEPAVVPVARGAAEEAPAQKAPAEDAPAAPRVTLPSTGSTSEWEISERVAGPTELPMAELPAADEPAVDETQAVDPTPAEGPDVELFEHVEHIGGHQAEDADPEPDEDIQDDELPAAAEAFEAEEAEASDLAADEPDDGGEDLWPAASPAIEELAHDVAAAAGTNPDPEPAVQAGEAEEPESLTVRPVETVSPMDLVMGASPKADRDEPEPGAERAPSTGGAS